MKIFIVSILCMWPLLIITACSSSKEKEVFFSSVDIKRFEIDVSKFNFVTAKEQRTGSTLSYKVAMKVDNYASFIKYTSTKGYPAWKKGGLHYSHIRLGENEFEDQVFFTQKDIAGHKLILCYDKVEGYLYMIDFKTGF